MKSARQARLEGTYQPFRHGPREHEPIAPGLLADEKPPFWLNARQQRLWREAVADAPVTVLRRIDRHVLTAFVLHMDALREITTAHNQAKLLDPEGRPSVYLRLLRQHSEVMVAMAAQLGFTPQARIRLGVPTLPPPPPETDNPHARFDVILPSGKRVPYAPSVGRRSGRLS